MDPTQNNKLQLTSRQFIAAAETFARKYYGSRRGSKETSESSTKNRRFRSAFGVDPIVCAIAWEWMEWKGNIPKGGNKEHLLWACFQLMVYPTDDVFSLLLNVDRKTFRMWSFKFLLALQELDIEVVSEQVCNL